MYLSDSSEWTHVYIMVDSITQTTYLLPLITKPDFSKLAISSLVSPISPLLGIRLPAFTYSAMAAPSPGNKAWPKLKNRDNGWKTAGSMKTPDVFFTGPKARHCSLRCTHSRGLSSWDIWASGASGPTRFSSMQVFSTHTTPPSSSSSSSCSPPDSSLLDPLDCFLLFFAFFFLDFFDLSENEHESLCRTSPFPL